MAEPLSIAVEVVGVDAAAADLARMEAAEEGVARAANSERSPAIARVEAELAQANAEANRAARANRTLERSTQSVGRAMRSQERNFAGVSRAAQNQGREFGTLVNIAGELGFTVGAGVPQFRTLGTQLAVVGGAAFQLGAIFGPLGVAFAVISGFLPQLVQGFADTAEELDNTATAADRASLAMSKLERRARTAGERIRAAISLAQGIENDEALLERVSTGDGSLLEQRGFLRDQRARRATLRAGIEQLLNENEIEGGEREILQRNLLRGEFGGSLDLQGSADTQARALAAQAATINASITEAEGFVARVEEIDRQPRAIADQIEAAEAEQIARDEADAERRRQSSGRQTREQRQLAEKIAQLDAEANEVAKLDRLERARFDASSAAELELRALRDEKLEQMEAEAANLEKLRTEEERLLETEGRKLAAAAQARKAVEEEIEARKELARAEAEQARVNEANFLARIKLNEKIQATDDLINGVGQAIATAGQLAAGGEMALGAALQQQFDQFLANTATQQTIEGFTDLARAASAAFIPGQGPAAAKAFAIAAGLHIAAAGLAGGA